jgi:hypothetical protein
MSSPTKICKKIQNSEVFRQGNERDEKSEVIRLAVDVTHGEQTD